MIGVPWQLLEFLGRPASWIAYGLLLTTLGIHLLRRVVALLRENEQRKSDSAMLLARNLVQMKSLGLSDEHLRIVEKMLLGQQGRSSASESVVDARLTNSLSVLRQTTNFNLRLLGLSGFICAADLLGEIVGYWRAGARIVLEDWTILTATFPTGSSTSSDIGSDSAVLVLMYFLTFWVATRAFPLLRRPPASTLGTFLTLGLGVGFGIASYMVARGAS